MCCSSKTAFKDSELLFALFNTVVAFGFYLRIKESCVVGGIRVVVRKGCLSLQISNLIRHG